SLCAYRSPLHLHPFPTRRSSDLAFAVDLRNGTGLNTALEGVDTVVHCASAPTGGDITSATQLIRAARAAQVGHLGGTCCTDQLRDRKSTRLNSSHVSISYAVFCL